MSRSVLLVSSLAVAACSAGAPSPAPPSPSTPPSSAPSAAVTTSPSVAVTTATPSEAPSSSATPSASTTAEPESAPAPQRPLFQATKAMCRCYNRSLTGEDRPDPDPCGDGTKETVEETFAEECVRAHDPNKDCPGLIACVNLEPSGYAECAKGEKYWPTSTCASCRCVTDDGEP